MLKAFLALNIDREVDFLLRRRKGRRCHFAIGFETYFLNSLEVCIPYTWYFAVTRRPPNPQQKAPIAAKRIEMLGSGDLKYGRKKVSGATKWDSSMRRDLWIEAKRG